MESYSVHDNSRANGRVLISGAGIAGPALALALAGRGFHVTVIERASALRQGGQAVDFRGPVHREVLERLGLWDAIVARRTRPLCIQMLGPGLEPIGTLPAVMTAGDVEILRGDLVALLHERTRGEVDYRFDERIVGLHQDPSGVSVELARSGTERFDWVVGAEGLHSVTRTLVEGNRASLVHHGYRLATFGVPAALAPADVATLQSEPGRAVMLSASGAEARALFVYEGGPMDRAERERAVVIRCLRERFAGMGGRVPAVLEAMEVQDDVYADAIASVRTPAYSRGRVVLLGDAAWGGTLGGQGTSLAVVGAYVLSGELAPGDAIGAAFARYEARMRPYATRCQRGAARAGSFFAPRTPLGLRARNAFYSFLTSPRMIGVFEWMVKDAASDFELPRYGDPGASGPVPPRPKLRGIFGPSERARAKEPRSGRALEASSGKSG